MVIFEATRIMALAAIAFLVALAVTPAWFNFIKKHHVRKQIRESDKAPIFHKFHEKKSGTPTAGGVIIWGTVLGLALLFSLLSKIFGGIFQQFNFINRAETYLPLAALFLAAILGLIDDWLGVLRIGGASGGGLKIRHKLLLYALLAGVGAWWFYFRLGWDVLYVPFVGSIAIGAWYIPLFIFIIVASAFSANETDGLDGLLGGVSLFAFAALTTVAFVLNRYDLAAFGSVTIGALLAFLWFNIYPAKFFMGDTGSMSLGITIGVISMLTNTTLFLPLFAFVLVIESLSVIIQLTSKKFFGRKVFLSTPIHHHFEALGWHESQVTMRFWIISVISSMLGLSLFFLARFF
ncbi:MAG TPA: phospho-N-acetylmuramoyl-pentapeptide-transferase [Candidatus Paceibacterota bacterium]|nr:phospho-N-acetylmuramoyl-pentapeptide-transferase [Candidatus Paceibacterota bacterium]